jgi:RNA polymerase sigma factor (sigma-70 family)
MEPRPPFSASDYWYLGSSDPDIDLLFRRACALAWPYALYCASRYLHDHQAAYDLMDHAVESAERYYERFHGQRNSAQLFSHLTSVIRRRSKQVVRGRKEISSGSLSDLDVFAHSHAAQSDAEQIAYIHQLLDRMSARSRQIAYWRLAGHSWRQIARRLNANFLTVRRIFHKEMRGLLFPASDSHTSQEGRESD